jgi:hypothetical protein
MMPTSFIQSFDPTLQMKPAIENGPFWRKWFWPSKHQIDLHLGLIREEVSNLTREIQLNHIDSIIFGSLEVEKLYRQVFGQIKIKSVVGFKKKRLGREADGGYVMLDRLDGIDAAYSLGIFDEVSWDLEMANRGIPVIQYDDSVDAPPVEHKHFTFSKKRIASSPNSELGHESLEGIVEGRKHDGKKLILKMDIEGSEWSVLDAVKEDTLKLFDQILLEVHDFCRIPEYEFRERALRVFKKLNLSHTPIHVHANNTSRVIKLVDFYFVDALELTYVRSDNYTFTECDEIFPGRFDCPNDPKKPDIFLGHFKFD